MEYKVKDYETRYFAGLELKGGINANSNDKLKIPALWDEFFEKYVPNIPDKNEPHKFIGLEIYPVDFMETKNFDYVAMVETKTLIEGKGEIVTKKLPKGKYISFPIKFDDIIVECGKVYKYVEGKKLNVHMGFDVEDYLVTQDYTKKGQTMHLTFLLKE